MNIVMDCIHLRPMLDAVRDADRLAFVNYNLATSGTSIVQAQGGEVLLEELLQAIDFFMQHEELIPPVHRESASVSAVILYYLKAELTQDIQDLAPVLRYGRMAVRRLKQGLADSEQKQLYFYMAEHLGSALVEAGVAMRERQLLDEAVTMFDACLQDAKRIPSLYGRFASLIGLARSHVALAHMLHVDIAANLEEGVDAFEAAATLDIANNKQLGKLSELTDKVFQQTKMLLKEALK